MLVMKDGIVSPAKIIIEPTVKRGGPSIDRAHSSGDIWTPKIFIDAIEKRFGELDWDLACGPNSCKAGHGLCERDEDSLQVAWHQLPSFHEDGRRIMYLNPPYSNITPWAKKCAAESHLGAEILLLVPMGGQNWYWDYVEPYADVYSVGRMTFDNCFDKEGNLVKANYPKDLVLAHFTLDRALTKMARWRWQQ